MGDKKTRDQPPLASGIVINHRFLVKVPTALNLINPTRNKVPCGGFATQRFLRVEDTLHFKYLIVACLQYANNSDAH